MQIDVVSDTICPWCYIGKRRLERALAASDGPHAWIGWRPFQLNPDMPVEGMERETYLAKKFGSRERAERVYAPIVDAGREEGIAFAFDRIKRTPNTLMSHRLIRIAGKMGRQNEAVDGLFRAYFEEGRDIGDLTVVSDVARDAGMDRDEIHAYLETDADLDRVRAEDAFARELGIQGVPCFIIERSVVLSGAQPPDVFQQAFATAAARGTVAQDQDAAGAPSSPTAS
ncbi:MAG: DsbA family oxidoreductase [Alphaproteobacteria bacterium]